MNSIYVNVPTMNDGEYIKTIERIYDTASNPDNVYVGTSMFWKKEDISERTGPFFFHFEKKLKKYKNVSYDILPWQNYPGVGYGRTESTKHYNNQKYFMSIDSHTIFLQDWDQIVENHYLESEKDFGKKRIITEYLPAALADTEDNPWEESLYKKYDGYNLSSLLKWPIFSYEWTSSPHRSSEYIFPLPSDKPLRIDNEIFSDGLYYPCNKINANFYFTESDPWLTKYNICLDKRINFWLEEFYQSALAYSYGYQFVFVKDFFMWHIYNNMSQQYIEDGLVKHESKKMPRGYVHDGEDLSNSERMNIFNKYISGNNEIVLQTDDNKLCKSLFEKDFSSFPRSLSGYLKYAGIDIQNRKVKPWDEVSKINVLYR